MLRCKISMRLVAVVVSLMGASILCPRLSHITSITWCSFWYIWKALFLVEWWINIDFLTDLNITCICTICQLNYMYQSIRRVVFLACKKKRKESNVNSSGKLMLILLAEDSILGLDACLPDEKSFPVVYPLREIKSLLSLIYHHPLWLYSIPTLLTSSLGGLHVCLLMSIFAACVYWVLPCTFTQTLVSSAR